MPAVARAVPKEIFSETEWSRLTRQSNWRGPGLIAYGWAVVIAAGWLVIALPNPATYLLAVMLIGARQLGFGILEHEAAHGTLHPNAKLNDWLATWFCSAPIGASLRRYRPYHLKHHKFTEQPEDPDLVLSAPFPISEASLRRKIIRDLTGQTFLKQRLGPAYLRLIGKPLPASPVADRPVLRFWLVNGAAIALLTYLGYWWVWPALWLVPMATWFPFVTRIRSMAEHAMVETVADPFTHARTTTANPLERLFIAPYWVHYHCEHHLFMYVPCYHLEKAHKLLVEKGYAPRMQITKGYPAVLRRCASKAA